MEKIENLANEKLFPGNIAALISLISDLKNGAVTAFTGAGTSVPLAPIWSALLKKMILEGVKEGFITNDDARALESQTFEDPLELASTLEESYTKERFRARLASIFDLDGKYTEKHELIVQLKLDGIVTLNYDSGLSSAYVRHRHNMPRIIRPDDGYEVAKWMHDSKTPSMHPPILHWHGNIIGAEKIILTADDYNQFYSISQNAEFLENLWRSRKLLIIGFGFNDPFLNRIAESVLRKRQVENSHFALIGRNEQQPVAPVLRRQYARKFRIHPIFYPIVVGEDGHEDHSALTGILQALVKISHKSEKLEASRTSKAEKNLENIEPSQEEKARRDFHLGLFTTPGGDEIYANPTLTTVEKDTASGDAELEKEITLSELVQSSSSYAISVPWEYGGTTLAKRILCDSLSDGKIAILRDARVLPNYAKKLQSDALFVSGSREAGKLLILDEVDLITHERLLKEVIGLNAFDRIILIVKGQISDVLYLEEINKKIDIRQISMKQMKRESIRVIAKKLFTSYDNDMVSAAVDKTYNDLLDLCIPLTPTNVIMYLSVLNKEGSFVPLNRLHIMDRYIRDMLYRPSDAYGDTFNTENKIDVLSAFVFDLHQKNRTNFTKKEWNNFAEAEIERSLSYFDKEELFNDLVHSRFIWKSEDIYHFKYKMFYSYFLAQYVTQRPSVLDKFVSENRHIEIDGLVEIIAGLSKDNTKMVSNILDSLERALEDFNDQYDIRGFDPYTKIDWAPDEHEQEKLWQPVTEQLAIGPATDSEVDRLKRSITAENRTADQIVIIREFVKLERSASFFQKALISALKESRGLDGDLKIRSMSAILATYKMDMQIGFLFSPIIASRKYFVWNGVSFINNIGYDEEDDKDKRTLLVIGDMPRAVAETASSEIGSKRLGEIFKYMVKSESLEGFDKMINFAAIIRAKPECWEETARIILNSTDRHALYLKYDLSLLMHQFREEVNTGAERISIKRLVANIHAKRQFKKSAPSNRLITKIVNGLETQTDLFE